MRFKYIFLILITGILLSGCANTSRQGANDISNTTPFNYDKRDVQNERSQDLRLNVRENPIKDYYQSDEKGVGHDGEEMNLYATDESRQIAQLLARRIDVNNHYISVFNNRVVVQLMTKPGENITDADLNQIESDIREIEPNKEIVIYTDDVLWNRKKDNYEVR